MSAKSAHTRPECARTGESVAQLLDRLARMARGLQYAEGQNPAQWESLRFIARANALSRNPGALATFLGTTKGTASQTVIALESKGYVRRVPDPSDRRAVRLEITDAGVDLLARDPLLTLDAAVAGLPAGIGGELAGGLGCLLAELKQRVEWREFGVCNKCGHFRSPVGEGAAQCGLLDQPLDATDIKQICADFSACHDR